MPCSRTDRRTSMSAAIRPSVIKSDPVTSANTLRDHTRCFILARVGTLVTADKANDSAVQHEETGGAATVNQDTHLIPAHVEFGGAITEVDHPHRLAMIDHDRVKDADVTRRAQMSKSACERDSPVGMELKQVGVPSCTLGQPIGLNQGTVEALEGRDTTPHGPRKFRRGDRDASALEVSHDLPSNSLMSGGVPKGEAAIKRRADVKPVGEKP